MNSTGHTAIVRQSHIVERVGLFPARVVLARNRDSDQYFTALEVHKNGGKPERVAISSFPNIHQASRDFEVRKTALEGA